MHDTSGTTLIQRHLDATQRESIVRTLQNGWWDCATLFRDDVVDLRDLGLSAESMRAMSADLAADGHAETAAALARAAGPVRPAGVTGAGERRDRHVLSARTARPVRFQGRTTV